jgi:hypothetical protein
MGAIVIQTRYDEGTESAEVATSDICMFSYEVKPGPIYGMEINIKSGNGWF